MANAALKLGMQVLGYDPRSPCSTRGSCRRACRRPSNLDDLFARADVVTVHVPLTKDTDKLVNAARLQSLRRARVLLNFSRGEIVDTAAVLAALDAGKLHAYVTDFPKRALLDHPKVICLPHLGASTVEAEENCAVMVADNVREFLENGNVTRSVNFPETVLQRTRPHRVAIPHANVPNMVAQILTGARRAEHQHRGHAQSLARRAVVHARRSRRGAERATSRAHPQHRRNPGDARAADHRVVTLRRERPAAKP